MLKNEVRTYNFILRVSKFIVFRMMTVGKTTLSKLYKPLFYTAECLICNYTRCYEAPPFSQNISPLAKSIKIFIRLLKEFEHNLYSWFQMHFFFN